ncbi:DUF3037 domain-containing protein [Glaesserella parasuis]|nr:DUF3037 domain-containing protein [Glaesserella parasuis]
MNEGLLYSFIRYRPYIETEEFANVGILICNPDKKELKYRLLEANNERVNHFFNKQKNFNIIRDVLNNELDYITHQSFDLKDNDEMIRFFYNYTDRKEGVIQYSSPKILVSDNSEMELDRLFSSYI